MNGELLSAEGNTYTYQIPEGSEELVIFVETETLAQKTEGEGDFSVNFSQATQSDVQGTLLLNPELLAPTVIEAISTRPTCRRWSQTIFVSASECIC